MEPNKDDLRASYDRVAAEYASRFLDELAHKPLDRALLDAFAEQTHGRGPVGDVGCGPGQIARYLHERGLPVVGIDLSAEMVALARHNHPGIAFEQGDMLALPAGDGAWAGLVAFYAIIHLSPDELPRALREFRRVLRPGGLALLSFHIGRETVHLDEWWDRPVALDFHFLEPATVAGLLEEVGFTVEARLERRPYTAVEHPSRRGYLLARKPGAEGR